MSANAIDELRAGFDEPFSALGRAASNDRETVVVAWPSMPVEIVRAAGLVPVFARGRAVPTPAADRVLEPDLFPSRLRQLVEAALTGRLADVAAIVLPRSSDPDYKCFLYLRELVRRGVSPALPPVLLFDALRSDDATARAYNADRVRAFSEQLATLGGRRHEPDELRRVIAATNLARAAARSLDALRTNAPRIAGADALALLGAFWQVEPSRYASLASTAADGIAARSALAGPRMLTAGAPVDSTTLHAAIEAEGAVVVAELSPFGRCGTDTDVEISDDPFAALALHYAVESIDARLPVEELMRRLGALLDTVDAVVISLPADDASFGWDTPRVRELLARRSIPYAVLTGDPAHGATTGDRARIRSLLDAARASLQVRCG
jgi:benzoyl-CoA reductase/2-hydroxyglutaryl-CoA dehydratase subunit BcrC/BadD/HgdB